MRRPFLSFALILMLFGTMAFVGCQTGPWVSAPKPSHVAVARTRFLDPSGKPILFHGINVVQKSKAQGYTRGISQADFALIRSWGMNCVRLGIFWDGLEPEPGRIDEEYLERVAQMVEWAKAAGLFVLVDMHQDLFSVKYSDGAPGWATLDGGKPHGTGSVWSDSYYISEAVQTALDNFWANAAASDGIGLQDHYAAVWRRVAERFRDETAVMGFDLMNEPFPGADAAKLLQVSLMRLAELLAPKPAAPRLTVAELARIQATPEGRAQILRWLADLDLYRGMIEAGTPIMQQFDRDHLQPFYHRVRRAIREVNTKHIIFFEPAMSANMGIPSALVPLTDDQGRRDPQQAYAPHGYDLVVDTPAIELTSQGRVALLFGRHGEFARTHQLPMLVGEWGAYSLDARAADAARFVTRQFDMLGCGSTYWDYSRALAESPLLPAIRRQPQTAR